jgi:hypothetical protein
MEANGAGEAVPRLKPAVVCPMLIPSGLRATLGRGTVPDSCSVTELKFAVQVRE